MKISQICFGYDFNDEKTHLISARTEVLYEKKRNKFDKEIFNVPSTLA